MDTLWHIDLLGGLRAHQGNRVIARFQTQKTAALLAYLAFYRHRSHPRDALIDLLWPESDRDAGRNRLKVALTSLRHQLEPPGVPAGAILVTNRAFVQLNPAACTTDVELFETAQRSAAQAGSGAGRAQFLIDAVELYRGELLSGYFEEWILPERERLAEAFIQALGQLIILREGAGDLPGALRWARQAVSTDPLREAGHRELMRLLALADEREAALRQYQELERLLAAELGDAPAPESRALARQIEEEARQVPPRRKGAPPPSGMTPPTSVPVSGVAPASVPAPLPTGTVTVLLTDIEASTALWDRLGDIFKTILANHHSLLRQAFGRHGGYEVKELGDGFLAAFDRAGAALACAVDGQRSLTAHPWPEEVGPLRVRMALHTGHVELQAGDYHGHSLHCAQRILLAAHGGQLLCSEETAGLLRRELPPDVWLTDLGVYRLRGVGTPERLFQVEYAGMAQHEFPPLKAEAGYAGSLPLQFTQFFDRQQEMRRLLGMVPGFSGGEPFHGPEAGAPRLVTLSGPGGTGKTRLALELASRLQEPFQGAVWFVSLADLTDPRLIADKALDALHVPRSPNMAPLEQVVASLSRQPSLLLLDNFEHLAAEGAPLVQTLLERVPSLSCLVTSRHRLDVAGEREFVVQPLPTPEDAETPEALTRCPSVQLFVDRAQAVRPDFQVTTANAPAVMTLCRKLEGLPLALELAAARSGVLTPQQMLARLEQRFELLVRPGRWRDPRHRSLWAALEWSYQLLAPELRRFFARLYVFRGGFTLTAAEGVCEEPHALEYLEQLQACSLVLAEAGEAHLDAAEGAEMRFRLFETVRDFARMQLTPEERAALEQQAAAFCLALVEEAEPEVRGPDQVLWLDRLEREHDNLRAALEWARQMGASPEAHLEAETGLRLAAALYRFWIARGSIREGRERLMGLLALPGARARTTARAKALSVAARLSHPYGDLAAAEALAEEGLAIQRELGERQEMDAFLNTLGNVAMDRGAFEVGRSYFEESLAIGRELLDKNVIAWAVFGLGRVAKGQEDFVVARAFFEESLSAWRQLGDKRSITFALGGLAAVALRLGDLGAAQTFGEESLAIQRELKDASNVAQSLCVLAEVAVSRTDYGRARALYEESLVIQRTLGDPRSINNLLHLLGELAVCEGDYGRARTLYEESLAIRRAVGIDWDIAHSLYHLGRLACYQGSYTEARALHEESLTIRRALGIPRDIAASLRGLAALAGAEGQPERATRLFGAAHALRQAIGAAGPPSELIDDERSLAAARAALGDTAFAAAWAAGQSLSLEEALAEALGSAEGPDMA